MEVPIKVFFSLQLTKSLTFNRTKKNITDISKNLFEKTCSPQLNGAC
jgi:hypothetical protein